MGWSGQNGLPPHHYLLPPLPVQTSMIIASCPFLPPPSDRAIGAFAARNKVATASSQWEEVKSMASTYMAASQSLPGEHGDVWKLMMGGWVHKIVMWKRLRYMQLHGICPPRNRCCKQLSLQMHVPRTQEQVVCIKQLQRAEGRATPWTLRGFRGAPTAAVMLMRLGAESEAALGCFFFLGQRYQLPAATCIGHPLRPT